MKTSTILEFLVSGQALFFAIMLGATLMLLLAGIGCGKMARVLFKASFWGLICGGAAGVITFIIFVAISAGGGGLGALYGALLLPSMVGLAVGLLVAIGVVVRSLLKQEGLLARGELSRVPLILGIACCALLVVSVVQLAPQLQTARSLAREVGTGMGPMNDFKAQKELLNRKGEAAEAIIAELREKKGDEISQAESGTTQGTRDLLLLLGELGGRQAVAELRRWVNREDVAPELRAVAAMRLAVLKDQQSLPAIKALLKHESNEWQRGGTPSLLKSAVALLETRK